MLWNFYHTVTEHGNRLAGGVGLGTRWSGDAWVGFSGWLLSQADVHPRRSSGGDLAP